MGQTYDTEVSQKFVEYLKHCVRTWSSSLILPISTDTYFWIVKEERQLYTLDTITDVAASPPPVSDVATPPVSEPPPAPPTTGPTRTLRKSTQARMQTGPMAPALKARVLKNVSNKKSTTGETQTNGALSEIHKTQADVAQVTVRGIAAKSTSPVEPTQHSQSTLTSDLSGSQQPPPSSPPLEDDVSDSISYTLTLPDVFDVNMDDSAPPATGPWIITDHLTGKMTVDGVDITAIAPAVQSNSTIQVESNPTLGTPILIQTSPLALLFEDMDVRPGWLTRAINDYLQHVPYYMCLGKVVDLFLTQEARLSYLLGFVCPGSYTRHPNSRESISTTGVYPLVMLRTAFADRGVGSATAIGTSTNDWLSP